MSNPERLVFTRVGITEEVCVTPHDDDMNSLRAVAVPREADIAQVLAGVSDDWFVGFLVELNNLSSNRAIAVARVVERTGLSDAAADVAGGDIDPGFGVNPKDSEELLRLRQAIDTHLGWRNSKEEHDGNYLERIKQAGEQLFALAPEAKVPSAADEQLVSCLELANTLSTDLHERLVHVQKLTERNRRQRKELRRLNASERERSLTVSLAHHQHSVYVNPDAERRRIAGLIKALRELFQASTPNTFTERAAEGLVDALAAWEEWVRQ